MASQYIEHVLFTILAIRHTYLPTYLPLPSFRTFIPSYYILHTTYPTTLPYLPTTTTIKPHHTSDSTLILILLGNAFPVSFLSILPLFARSPLHSTSTYFSCLSSAVKPWLYCLSLWDKITPGKKARTEMLLSPSGTLMSMLLFA